MAGLEKHFLEKRTIWLISNCFHDEMMVYMEFTEHSIRAKYHRKSNGFHGIHSSHSCVILAQVKPLDNDHNM